jgi:hypothetical protein
MAPRDIAISVEILTSGSNGIVLIFYSILAAGEEGKILVKNKMTIKRSYSIEVQYHLSLIRFFLTFLNLCVLLYITVLYQCSSIGELKIKKGVLHCYHGPKFDFG